MPRISDPELARLGRLVWDRLWQGSIPTQEQSDKGLWAVRLEDPQWPPRWWAPRKFSFQRYWEGLAAEGLVPVNSRLPVSRYLNATGNMACAAGRVWHVSPVWNPVVDHERWRRYLATGHRRVFEPYPLPHRTPLPEPASLFDDLADWEADSVPQDQPGEPQTLEQILGIEPKPGAPAKRMTLAEIQQMAAVTGTAPPLSEVVPFPDPFAPEEREAPAPDGAVPVAGEDKLSNKYLLRENARLWAENGELADELHEIRRAQAALVSQHAAQLAALKEEASQGWGARTVTQQKLAETEDRLGTANDTITRARAEIARLRTLQEELAQALEASAARLHRELKPPQPKLRPVP